MANEPSKRINVGNGIHVAIWKNESDKGEAWYTIKLTRKYKDGEGFKDTTTFRRDDLLFVAKGAEMAFSWCFNHEESERKAKAKS